MDNIELKNTIKSMLKEGLNESEIIDNLVILGLDESEIRNIIQSLKKEIIAQPSSQPSSINKPREIQVNTSTLLRDEYIPLPHLTSLPENNKNKTAKK